MRGFQMLGGHDPRYPISGVQSRRFRSNRLTASRLAEANVACFWRLLSIRTPRRPNKRRVAAPEV